MTEEFENNRIEEYMNKTTWLHFQDALSIGKIQLFAGSYRKGQGSDLSLSHYIDTLDVRPLLHDLSWGKPVNFVDYKGTVGEGGAVSRVLRVNAKDDKVYWSFVHGPGTPTDTGAVMPKANTPDAQKQKLNVGMTKEEARQIAYSVLEYMTAWRTAGLLAQPKAAARVQNQEDIAMAINEIVDDLFGDEPPPTSAAAPELLPPEVAIAAGKFLNGYLCPPEFKNWYDEFVEAKHTAPRNNEHLGSWRYRN
ncbi:MAG: hypothetical protein H6658_12310 [Ardenticatenaceae bacterium]|nr:hypothetical protein [Ardenticatenaceae bacterium]